MWELIQALIMMLARPLLRRWVELPPADSGVDVGELKSRFLSRWYSPARGEMGPVPRKRPVKSLQRERLVHVVLGIAACALTLRFVHLQWFRAEEFSKKASRQQVSEEPVMARPGDLLDRHGRLLATTIIVPSLYVCPSRITDVDDVSRQLAGVLQLDQQTLRDQLARNSKKHFLWVKRRLTDEQAVAVRDLKLSPRVYGFRREFQRHYPQGSLAAHVLGIRDIDGMGRGGLEEALHSRLTGQDGVRRFVRDARGYVLDVLEEVTQPPVDGETITLTLDTLIQLHVEHQLDLLIQKHHPDAACAIVINPRSGELLAMASRPAFDPNHPERAGPEVWKNMAISSVFEPGSTFKPMVVAWALDQGVIERDEVFDCENGAYRMGRRVLHDHHRYGELSLTDVLVKSSNIGMAKIGEKLGNEQLYELANAFGFGRKTGVELPGELSGILHPLEKWTSYSTGSIPMGQELAATPVQMVVAHAALANHGVRVTPHFVRSSRGSSEVFRPLLLAQVAGRETSDWLVNGPLLEVVRRGTAKQARVPGVDVFGKTGTAQKLSTDGAGYSSTRHMSSFIGGAPADNPQLLVLISVDEPRGADQYGGGVAGPFVAAILKQALAIQAEDSHKATSLRTMETDRRRSDGRVEIY